MAARAISQGRPVSARVQGVESLVEDLTLHDGKSLELELGIALTDNPTLKRTIFGADSIDIEVFDPERRLLRHSLVAEKWDVDLDGLRFRYPGGLTKSGDNLTLTLENRWIALLREAKGPKRVDRGDGPQQMTRAEFIKMLVDDACGKRLRFYCPQLHVKQPIKNAEQGKQAKSEAKENRAQGLGDVGGLTVKGIKATKAQIEAGDRALRAAASHNAPFRIMVALMAALMEESVLGDAASNWLQLIPSTAAESGINPSDLEASVDGFLTGYLPGEQGALSYYKENPSAEAYEIAQAVQKSGAGAGSNGAGNYGPRVAESREWVEAFGGGGLGAGGGARDYEFVVKKDQDYWSAIKELAREVNWRAFVVANVFYYLPEPELEQGMVRLAIDGDLLDNPESGIENVDFEYDGNDPVTEIEIQALVRQWKPPPGSVVTLADHGPASLGFGDAPVKADKKEQKVGISSNRKAKTGEGRGRYVVSSIEVPVADDPAQRMATIKAHRATLPLPEPAAASRAGGSAAGDLRGAPEKVATIIETIDAFDRAGTDYLWGGGHSSFAAPTERVDCSGFWSAVLHAAGYLTRPVTSGEFANVLSRGEGEWVTIYGDAEHVLGKVKYPDGTWRWAETDPGNPGSGPGWVPESAAHWQGKTASHPEGL
ncbi:MAG TPA: hypothetical protein VI039_12890 [Solirubrobacterales bacterium]